MRKIIHIDMDCFYAAIEMRDNPSIRNKPIAVGGSPSGRGVICTANYVARKYGVRSAMASYAALRLCPNLLILPVSMEKYRKVALQIRAIFQDLTKLIEPLSLDEAFLDVTDCIAYQGSATLIAKAIRHRIKSETGLTASAGVAPNKFLAKVASDWEKPDGMKVIVPSEVADFVKSLPVEKIFGVGKVTAQKMESLDIHTCEDLQRLSSESLAKYFGSFGLSLYELCRGIDHRPVNPNRIRKSVSVECTFQQDLPTLEACEIELPNLLSDLKKRLLKHTNRAIRKQFVKIKFNDFQLTTAESVSQAISLDVFKHLLNQAFKRQQKPVRLLGLGVTFAEALPGELQQVFNW